MQHWSYTIGALQPLGSVTYDIPFGAPLTDDNYAIVLSKGGMGAGWADVEVSAVVLTSTGFKLMAYNTSPTYASESLKIYWCILRSPITLQ